MFHLDPQYVTDSQNKKIAVQLNIKTYNKIEEILENYSLYQFMEEEIDIPLELNEAKAHYAQLKKEKIMQVLYTYFIS